MRYTSRMYCLSTASFLCTQDQTFRVGGTQPVQPNRDVYRVSYQTPPPKVLEKNRICMAKDPKSNPPLARSRTPYVLHPCGKVLQMSLFSSEKRILKPSHFDQDALLKVNGPWFGLCESLKPRGEKRIAFKKKGERSVHLISFLNCPIMFKKKCLLQHLRWCLQRKWVSENASIHIC